MLVYAVGYLVCCSQKLRALNESSKICKSKTADTIRTMQVLHTLWQFCFKNSFLPGFMAVWMSLVALAAFGTVRLSGLSALKMGVTVGYSFIYLFVVVGMGAKLEENSSKFLRSWNYRLRMEAGNQRKELRVAWSVKGFRMDVGNALYVERETILKIANVVLNSTITLVLV